MLQTILDIFFGNVDATVEIIIKLYKIYYRKCVEN